MRQNRLNYFLFLLLVGMFNPSLTATTPPTVEQQVIALNRRLEQNLLQSNKHLENSEFHQAEALTTQVLADLDYLLEATMPLDERINKLIEKEEIILTETKKLKNSKQSRSQQEILNKMLEELIFDQVKNREKTETAAALTKKQLEAIQNIASQGSGQQADRSEQEKKVLNEVRELLIEAADLQTVAIDHLEEVRLKTALQFEADALESLKKALEKLRQHKKSQSQAGNNQQSGQQKNEQKQASEQKQQEQTPKQQSGNENNQNENTQGDSIQKKKMEAEEALKQLAKLRKKAREEQERRKREYGIQESEGQIPVEKDW